ncbi:MAG: hypothetical protein U9R74_04855 [Pseudomonadota bacterium]|nr:hypothetical protein [Pseudomonadota bacterium]
MTKRLFIPVIFVVLALASCTLPKTYDAGIRKYQEKDYASAVELLQQAAAESPGNDKMLSALTDAKTGLAEEKVRSAENLPRYDLPGRISLLADAGSLDPGNARASQLLQEANLERETILAEARQISGQASANPEDAWKSFTPLLPYREYMEGVASAYRTVADSLAGKYNGMGYEALDGDHWGEAKSWFDRTLQAVPENPQAQAGLKAIKTARKAGRALIWKRRNSSYSARY